MTRPRLIPPGKVLDAHPDRAFQRRVDGDREQRPLKRVAAVFDRAGGRMDHQAVRLLADVVGFRGMMRGYPGPVQPLAVGEFHGVVWVMNFPMG